MIQSTAFWATLAAAGIGLATLWANPHRALNRALFGFSLHTSLWLLCLSYDSADGPGGAGMRFAAALLAFMPAHGKLLKDIIVRPSGDWRANLWRCRAWLVFGAIMAIWASTKFFLPSTGFRVRENTDLYGFYSYMATVLAAASFLGAIAVTEMNAFTGVRRIELQILLMGGGAAAIASTGLLALGGATEMVLFPEVLPLVMVALLAGICWTLTASRVHDSAHILSAAVERIILVIGVVSLVWSVQQLADQFVHPGTAYVISLSVGLWFAAEMHPWLRSAFRRRSRSTQLRRAVFEIAKKEVRAEVLEDAFIKAIKDCTSSENVVILMRSQTRLTGCGLDWPIDAEPLKALHALRWVTPERLDRERADRAHDGLRALLAEHDFGVMVASGGPSLSFVVAVSAPVTRQPFTYPEVMRLIEVGAMMENSLSRARYLMQAQHAEQLATVGLLGASIAHEIRNPLVSIKTFVQLLPDHYDEAAFREKFFRLIGDEVGRIDRLTEQLLDLAAPRTFSARSVELHAILKSCLDLVAAKAEDKGVTLIPHFSAGTEQVHTDPNALKQVLLNLSFNAIQALEQHPGERWIRLETFSTPYGVEVRVTDSGPGISQEVWPRLFQPFHSTKSSGFGLGLAICKDILSSLQATISADPPVAGRGATFRIVLPCQPLTS